MIPAVLAILGGFAVVIFLVAAFAAKVYNELIKLQNRYENAFAQIDVQLTRRHDLIPNLVETAKGYMKHEKETLEKMVEIGMLLVLIGSDSIHVCVIRHLWLAVFQKHL